MYFDLTPTPHVDLVLNNINPDKDSAHAQTVTTTADTQSAHHYHILDGLRSCIINYKLCIYFGNIKIIFKHCNIIKINLNF